MIFKDFRRRLKAMSQIVEEKPATPSPAPSSALPPAQAESLSLILKDTAERLQPMMEELATSNTPPAQIMRSYAAFFQKLYEDPKKLADMQVQYMKDWITLWQESTKRFMGHPGQTLYRPDSHDRRFKSPAWEEGAAFDFIKQSYLMTSQWMHRLIESTQGLDPETKRRVDFYTRQFADALSPSNFILTNPEVLKATLDSKGENLIRGFRNMMEDLERGKGHLKISTTDYNAFELGKNIANTPGQVVFENELMQLIQYEPTTESVFKTPLLIVPPWINKFYILDLQPEKSFIRWLVEQGHTVFIISWANPTGPALADKCFTDYIHDGLSDALDKIRDISGEEQANVIGYCIGGTLLTTALGWMAATGEDQRIASATFLTTLVDFSEPGDISVFIDDALLETMERDMAEKGYFEGRNLKDTFSLLRANDLIWTFVVNNYLLGREPFPFDLLYWNDDSTNMPAAMHSFYLRNMYRDNLLVKPGGIIIDKTPVDITKVKTPTYFLSTREDHIAPWQSTYATTQIFSGPVLFTLSGSGHVAGVVNPPKANKYGYWTAPQHPANPEDWLAAATHHDGSWWVHWQKWIEPHAGEKVPARKVENPIEPAPGRYVRVRAD